MREWVAMIRGVDERFAETLVAGFYQLQHEERLTVTGSFDAGRQCLETVSNWRGTRVPTSLVSRLEGRQAPVTVEQEVRLRLLRRCRQMRSRVRVATSPAVEAPSSQPFAYSSAVRESNSNPTTASSPTTHASCPGSITYAWPARISCSVPSS